MSATTPNYVLQQSIFAEGGIIVPTKDYRKYMLDLNGWFMWQGEMYDMVGKSMGAGLTRITAEVRLPNREEIAEAIRIQRAKWLGGPDEKFDYWLAGAVTELLLSSTGRPKE